MDFTQALKLSPDLFTPLTRTPWAGFDIARRYKRKWVDQADKTSIGESWEVSCDPAFPSRILSNNSLLLDVIRAEPERMLSPAYVQKFGPNCDILIKLINAAEPLSLQVHPTDDDKSLKASECGKPESWLVLNAEPGAGLYLGFSKAIERDDLAKLLYADGDLKPYLQFVPVKEGDFFEIDPGVVHAIGPGVTLLEPQRVRTGKAGKTYRFWDWSRRYNADGSLNMKDGKPRELHIEEGLRLIDPTKQVGLPYVASLRRKALEVSLGSLATVFSYPANSNYQVHYFKLKAKAKIRLNAPSGFLTFVCLKGDGLMNTTLKIGTGEPGFVPYSALPLSIEAVSDFDIAIVVPPSCDLSMIQV
ncbi:MAG: class I mannose-6-phosphate isomerase [Chitinophagaceae bacterium]|nr:class I mannose-6-phosphate isomerase [Oligoflexus sp.]